MKHHKSIRKFGRKANVRNALIKSLAVSLIEYGAITTTEAKAKELRPFVETIVTRAKNDTLSNRRLVVSRLMNNEKLVKKMFAEIAPKFKTTSGGYTRIIKLGRRTGDASPMAQISFV